LGVATTPRRSSLIVVQMTHWNASNFDDRQPPSGASPGAFQTEPSFSRESQGLFIGSCFAGIRASSNRSILTAKRTAIRAGLRDRYYSNGADCLKRSVSAIGPGMSPAFWEVAGGIGLLLSRCEMLSSSRAACNRHDRRSRRAFIRDGDHRLFTKPQTSTSKGSEHDHQRGR
jgi:hypothetical protein